MSSSAVLSRRQLLLTLPAAALAQTKPLKITAVEIWQVRGPRETVRGIDQQYQVNPLHIYDELRPRPYADSANPSSSNAAVSALYLKIRTDGGIDGFYGPIDKEVARKVSGIRSGSLLTGRATARQGCG